MKLTATTVRSLVLPAGKTDHVEWDDDVSGFGVRIREGGSRSFVFQYKLGTKNRRMSLGSITAGDIGNARETAKNLYAKVRLGQDPQGEKVKSRIAAAETFKAAAEEFLSYKQTELRRGSYVGMRHHLMVHARALHHLQLAKIDRRDIANAVGAVTKNAGLVTANRTRSSLSSMFAWAIGQGRLDLNPVVGTVPNKGEKPRERLLTPEELCLIWNALANDHYGSIVKLLALTAQRANDMIELPAARVKNGKPHTIPISQAVGAIIEAQPRRVGPDGELRDQIFGFGNGPFSGWSACKERLDRNIAEAAGGSLVAWRIHDLRRTAITGMANLGIAPHVVEAIANHVSGRSAVANIYNRSSYDREKRPALEAWAGYVTMIVGGREQQSNVMAFRQPA
jgi:integrase